MTTGAQQSAVADAVGNDGIGTWPGFVTGDPLQALRRHSARLASGEHALRFPKSTRVWDLYRHGAPYLDLLARHDLEPLLVALLGEHPILSDFSLNIVLPHQPEDDWHIDYPYNEMPRPVTGSVLGIQCILALDAFTAANGATVCIPGSHLRARKPDGGLLPGAPTCLEVAAGTLIVMAASTWHRSGYNTTGQPRSAILLSFVERWVRPMVDPPEPGPWSATRRLRLLLGQERPPETINGVPIDGGIQ